MCPLGRPRAKPRQPQRRAGLAAATRNMALKEAKAAEERYHAAEAELKTLCDKKAT